MDKNLKVSAVIVAAGSGTRMGSSVPKQFLSVASKPILAHTIEKFCLSSLVEEVVVVLPPNHIEMWNDLCKEADFDYKYIQAKGGASRTESVKNGLEALSSKDGVVLIHDGVRPFVTDSLIEEVARAATKFGSVVPAVKVVDSLRQLSSQGEGSVAIDRDAIRAVQTPQGFKLDLLLEAYNSANKDFSDDSSLMEWYGVATHLVEGETTNIKITSPIDMLLSEVLFANER